LAEASAREAERRRLAYRQLLEEGVDADGQPLTPVGRAAIERSLARFGEQPQGP